KSPGRWILVLLLAFVALGGLSGPAGLTAMTQYVLGFGGGLWAALSLHLASRKINGRARRWLESGSVSIALFAVTAVLAVPQSPFFPANLINYHMLYQTIGFHIQVMRGLFIVWTIVAVWGYSQELIGAETGRDFQRLRAKYTVRFVVILLFIFGLGLAATDYLSRNARTDLVNESTSNINALANHLQDQMEETDHAVMSIAASPEVLPALVDGGEQNVARANFILDRFNEALDAPVCYLLDEDGTVIASSNRNDPDSYVGNNYGFRPYFKQAMSGNAGSYYALGLTSGERGHYVSYPVISGRVIGVAVIKRKIDSVELGFKQYPYCFYIDPHGIVFLSSRPDMLYKGLWPLEESAQKELIESRQFGTGPFETMSLQEVTNRADVVYDGQRFLINRKQTSPAGWSIVLLAPMDKTRPAGLLGIIITFCLSILTISFFVTTQRLTESAVHTATSEENYQSVFNGVNEGIFVHEMINGKIIDVNKKMCEMYGCTREEAVNAQLVRFVAGEPPYTVKDAALLLKKTADGEPQLVEWLAKDTAGRLFWTEINLKKALICGKECILAVVRDITVRKMAEESLQKSQAKYMNLYENANDIIFSSDLKGNITSVNRAASNVFGYTKEELKTMSVSDLLTPESLEHSRILLARALAEKTDLAGAQPFEAGIFTASGEKIYLEVRTHLIWKGSEISGFQGIARDITRRKQAEEALRSTHQQLLDIVEFLPDAIIVVDQDKKVIAWNRAVEEMTGVGKDEMLGKGDYAYAVPFYGKPRPILIDLVFEDDKQVERCYEHLERKDTTLYGESFLTLQRGKRVYFWAKASPLYDNEGKLIGAIESIRDITERKWAEEALRESEANYRTVFENTGTALAIFEEDTTIALSNTEFSRLSGYPRVEIEGKKSWTEFATKEELGKMLEYHYARRGNRYAAPGAYESKFIKGNGEIRDVLVTVALIPGTPKSVASFLDISERKRTEEQLKYLSLHDSLTGLYNRTFFEEEMRRLAGKRDLRVGMLICDIDGLKLVNDTLGHEAGDRLLMAAAGIIRECFREGDMVARIGGDEFAVLLPDGDEMIIEKAAQRIKEEVEKYNAAGAVPPLSMSIGFSMSGKTKGNLSEVFKEADNNMYREKLHCGQSARSAIVQTLMKALEARDYITEGHAERLQELVEALASAIGLPERSLADLRLLAKFHDIGKVGIPDRILFKPGPLTSDEYSEMKRHSEIGHRIAQTNPDLSPIAGWILKHHEWWGGQGYPQGLKGEEIPLECRILAIVDAFDAMTNDRPYRRALSREEAIAEIKKCAGTQFDPELSKVFLQVLQQRQ
ncbi:MAG: PAS domain S-box protein, partial [Desulfotomaculaceae bacterium]